MIRAGLLGPMWVSGLKGRNSVGLNPAPILELTDLGTKGLPAG